MRKACDHELLKQCVGDKMWVGAYTLYKQFPRVNILRNYCASLVAKLNKIYKIYLNFRLVLFYF